jgi:hypothetical protein
MDFTSLDYYLMAGYFFYSLDYFIMAGLLSHIFTLIFTWIILSYLYFDLNLSHIFTLIFTWIILSAPWIIISAPWIIISYLNLDLHLDYYLSPTSWPYGIYYLYTRWFYLPPGLLSNSTGLDSTALLSLFYLGFSSLLLSFSYLLSGSFSTFFFFYRPPPYCNFLL